MATDLSLNVDLQFSVDLPGSRTVTGTVTGSGKALELRVSDPFLFAGRSDSDAIQGLAKAMARRGVSLDVIAPSGPLLTLGATRTSWLQRRVTGSRHIRIERGRGLWSLLRARTQSPSGGILPARDLVPPPTLFPFAPTMVRRPRRRVTTTHDPYRGGNARLVMAPRTHPGPNEQQEEFLLRDDVTTIGSGGGCDIRLAGLEPLHAEIVHDARDEFVIVRIGPPGSTRVHGVSVDKAMLRTGSGIDIGAWHLSYFREEYADHGRPYGGRIGGELGYQRPQPNRLQMSRLNQDER